MCAMRSLAAGRVLSLIPARAVRVTIRGGLFAGEDARDPPRLSFTLNSGLAARVLLELKRPSRTCHREVIPRSPWRQSFPRIVARFITFYSLFRDASTAIFIIFVDVVLRFGRFSQPYSPSAKSFECGFRMRI